MKVEGNARYRYQWKVIVNDETDENGWQYNWRFENVEDWRITFDANTSWVREVRRHGRLFFTMSVEALAG